MRKKPRQQKICAYCGKVFLAKRKDAVYCSTNCCQMSYYERNRETVLRKNRQRRLNGIIQKNTSEFNRVFDIAVTTKLSYGIVRAFYPDMNRIKFLADYKKIVNGVKL